LKTPPHGLREMGDLPFLYGTYVDPVDEDLPLCRTFGQVKESEEGGLAGSRGTREEDEYSPRANRQRNIDQGVTAPRRSSCTTWWRRIIESVIAQ